MEKVLLKTLNNNFLVAEDIDDYISKAILLSKDLDKLNSIRQDLYNNILSSNFFNIKKFSKNFNNLLLDIYQDKKKILTNILFCLSNLIFF